MKKNLPRLIAALCVSFFLQSFKREGWTDETFERWKPRQAPRTVKKSQVGRNILVKSGRLRREVNSSTRVATWDLIKFEIDLPYASAHNQGFTGDESVKGHKRRITARVQVHSIRTKRRTTVSASVGETEVKGFTRHMVLPKRKFMGKSKTLHRQISELIQAELKKCTKP